MAYDSDFPGLLERLKKLEGEELLIALRTLSGRVAGVPVLDAWEKTTYGSGADANQERWIRRTGDGKVAIAVDPVAWVQVERSGRRERVRVTRISVQLQDSGLLGGTTSNVMDAFRLADENARKAGFNLVGGPPKAEDVTGGTEPYKPPPPLDVPVVPAFRPAQMVQVPEQPASRDLKVIVGGWEPGQPKKVNLSEIDAQIMDAIGKLTDESKPTDAASITQHTGLDRAVVRATLKKLHKENQIAPLFRPRREDDPAGIAEFDGMVVAGFRLAETPTGSTVQVQTP